MHRALCRFLMRTAVHFKLGHTQSIWATKLDGKFKRTSTASAYNPRYSYTLAISHLIHILSRPSISSLPYVFHTYILEYCVKHLQLSAQRSSVSMEPLYASVWDGVASRPKSRLLYVYIYILQLNAHLFTLRTRLYYAHHHTPSTQHSHFLPF